MSKQKNEKRVSNGYVLGAFSFLAIVFFAISAILNSLGIGSVFGWLGQIFVLLTIFWAAWLWVKHQKRWVKIVYIVLLVITIVFFVFGNIWRPW
jgi:Ca2+/Na+ antiporter